jgi:hypothetical protein
MGAWHVLDQVRLNVSVVIQGSIWLEHHQIHAIYVTPYVQPVKPRMQRICVYVLF